MSAANTELLSCPFCGGEAKVSTLKWGGGYTSTALCKNEPNAHYLNTWDEDEAKAVERITEAWNTRHVETCKVVGSYYSELMDVYVFSFSCRDSIWWNDEEPPNYCPDCGRKVEG